MMRWLLDRFVKKKKIADVIPFRKTKELPKEVTELKSKAVKIAEALEEDHDGLSHQNGRTAKNLAHCHFEIQAIARIVAKRMDVVVIEGWRSKKVQEEYFKKGTSWVHFPHSYHNTLNRHIYPNYQQGTVSKPDDPCSLAMDIIPYPVDFNDMVRFKQLKKIIHEVAADLDIPLEHGYDKWGKDWPHWQLTTYRRKDV